MDLWGPLVAGQHPDLSALADVLLSPHPYGHGGHHTMAIQQAHSNSVSASSSMKHGAMAAVAAADVASAQASDPMANAVASGVVLSAAEVAAAEAAAAAAANGAQGSSGSQAGAASRGSHSGGQGGPGVPPGSGAGVRGVPVTGPLELRCAMAERCLKARVGLAVDHFNKDFKKGFAAMQVGRALN